MRAERKKISRTRRKRKNLRERNRETMETDGWREGVTGRWERDRGIDRDSRLGLRKRRIKRKYETKRQKDHRQRKADGERQ